MNSYDYKYEEVKKEHPAYLEYDYKEVLKELPKSVASKKELEAISNSKIDFYLNNINEYQREIINHFNNGMKIPEIIKLTGFHEYTVKKIIYTYQLFIYSI